MWYHYVIFRDYWFYKAYLTLFTFFILSWWVHFVSFCALDYTSARGCELSQSSFTSFLCQLAGNRIFGKPFNYIPFKYCDKFYYITTISCHLFINTIAILTLFLDIYLFIYLKNKQIKNISLKHSLVSVILLSLFSYILNLKLSLN